MEHHNALINRLQQAYSKEYNQVQTQDILDLLEHHEVSKERCGHLYTVLIDSCKFLPKRKEIKEAFEHGRSSFAQSTDGVNLHPQSPKRATLVGQTMNCDKIVDKCKDIRERYDAEAEVSGADLSFLIHWEHIVSVQEDDREVVKKLILAENQEELYSFLETAVKKVPIADIKANRKGKTMSIKAIMEDMWS
jgi:hypothetical protein